MNSRRSFLAALADSVASRVLPAKTRQQAALGRFDDLWEQLKDACKDGPIWQPFWVWEYTELTGKAERFEILPLPLPDEMLVEQVGVHFPAEVRFATLKDWMNDYLLVAFLGLFAGVLIGWLTSETRPRSTTRRVHRRVHHGGRLNPKSETRPVDQDTELSELRKMAGLQ